MTASGKLARMPGGRPPIGPAKLLRFRPEVAEAVAAMAEEEGRTEADLYRELVDLGLAAKRRKRK